VSKIRNHAFIDGNNRTGVLATILFCNLNGYPIETSQEDLIASALDIAEGQIDVEGSRASSRAVGDLFFFRRASDNDQ